MCSVKHREVILPADETLPKTQEHAVQKTVTIWAYVFPMFWHRIDIAEHHMIRDKAPAGASEKRVRKQWTQTSYVKEYGEHPAWTTYRC